MSLLITTNNLVIVVLGLFLAIKNLYLYNINHSYILKGDGILQEGTDKISRILDIYTKLIEGKNINKLEESQNHNVNERSIQRDIEDIRYFFEADTSSLVYGNEVVYDRVKKVYTLKQTYNTKFTNPEVLAICKILLESRAFIKEEMENLLEKIIISCVPEENRKIIDNLIKNELFHYIGPRHGISFLDNLWTLSQGITRCHYINIKYLRLKDKSIVTRKVKPLAIMFCEYYFYLAAFIEDDDLRENFDVVNDSFPTIYRVDRIKNITLLDEKFSIPYKDKFKEGEFKKRIQFMYGGKLQKIKFKYKGLDINAILDRLPTALVLSEEDGIYIVQAEVFGKGIDMWIRSQGDNIELI